MTLSDRCDRCGFTFAEHGLRGLESMMAGEQLPPLCPRSFKEANAMLDCREEEKWAKEQLDRKFKQLLDDARRVAAGVRQ